MMIYQPNKQIEIQARRNQYQQQGDNPQDFFKALQKRPSAGEVKPPSVSPEHANPNAGLFGYFFGEEAEAAGS